jgi:hypothetical protein
MAKVTNDPFARYTKATTDVKARIIANSVGEVGTGKTSFWLGAPGPIVVQTLDLGLEGVVENHADSKDIYVASYDIGQTIGASFTHEKAQAAATKFVEDFEHAIQNARTIVWDRETDVWSLFQYAEFGTDDAYGAAPPKDWDKLKGRLRRMVAMAKASDVNFGLIQGMKNEWIPVVNKKTGAKAAGQSGKRVASGMDEIDALVHTNLFHERNGKDFSITVGKSRGPGGFDCQDQTFENMSFTELAMLIYPDTDESNWS